MYNYLEDRWTHSEIGTEFVFSATGAGVTLDGLDAYSASLDDLGASLDSSQWFGGGRYLGAICGGQLFSFGGDPLAATIDSGEFQTDRGRRSFVREVRPESDGVVTVQIGHRKTPRDSVTWSPVSAVDDASGLAPFRIDDFYMRVRLNISGGFTDAVGVYVDAKSSGSK